MKLAGRLNALLVIVALVGLGVAVYRSLPTSRTVSSVDVMPGAPSTSLPRPSSTDLKRALVVPTPGPGLQRIDARSFTAKLYDADALAPGLSSQLPAAWSRATRGLSRIALVPATAAADITVYFKDLDATIDERSAEHEVRRGRILRERWIEIYIRDRGRALTPAEVMTIVLHELGHLWCCFGADAGTDGHWAANVADPRLAGIDRYGIMGPIRPCSGRPPAVTCATRFSDRELRAMGFTDALPDPR